MQNNAKEKNYTEEIFCRKERNAHEEKYFFEYDGRAIRVEKDRKKNRYTRIFVDGVLHCREKENEKETELRLQGKSSVFFLYHWYQSRFSFLRGKAYFGLGIRINNQAVSKTIAAPAVRQESGRLPLLLLIFALASRSLVIFSVFFSYTKTARISPQVSLQLSLLSGLYAFFLTLLLFYFFTYAKNPLRALWGGFMIALLQLSEFIWQWTRTSNTILFIFLVAYFFFLVFSSLFYAYRAWQESHSQEKKPLFALTQNQSQTE